MNYRRLRSLIGIAFLAAAIGPVSLPRHAWARVLVLAGQPVTESASAWQGFSDSFQPSWWGETRRINWSRNGGGSTGVTITRTIYNNEISVPRPWPVKLLSAHRQSTTDAFTTVSAGGQSQYASDEDEQESNDKGWMRQSLARYARVIDLDDLTVGEGDALAANDSVLLNGLFSVTHRVATFGQVDPLVHGTATASASVTTTAKYEVYEPLRFTLQGLFNGESNASGAFTIQDASTGAVVFEQAIADFSAGGGVRFDWSGVIQPGTYDFGLTSEASEAVVNRAGVVSPGGTGEFRVNLAMFPADSADFNDDGLRNAGDLFVWSRHYGERMPGDMDGDLELRKNDYEQWSGRSPGELIFTDDDDYAQFKQLAAAERPADANLDLATDGTDFLFWQRAVASTAIASSPMGDWTQGYGSTSARGDIDGSGLVDGADFLLAQRMGLTAGQAASFVASVPEPPTILISVVAVVCALGTTVRRTGRDAG